MSLYLTDKLGPKVDSRTGRWVPISETYLEGRTTTLAKTRLVTAQLSDTYLVRWFIEVTSNIADGTIIPRVDFFTYGTGAGRAVSQIGTTVNAASAADADTTHSQWQLIRAARSDIFITLTVSDPARYNVYVSISRPS